MIAKFSSPCFLVHAWCLSSTPWYWGFFHDLDVLPFFFSHFSYADHWKRCCVARRRRRFTCRRLAWPAGCRVVRWLRKAAGLRCSQHLTGSRRRGTSAGWKNKRENRITYHVVKTRQRSFLKEIGDCYPTFLTWLNMVWFGHSMDHFCLPDPEQIWNACF